MTGFQGRTAPRHTTFAQVHIARGLVMQCHPLVFCSCARTVIPRYYERCGRRGERGNLGLIGRVEDYLEYYRTSGGIDLLFECECLLPRMLMLELSHARLGSDVAQTNT